MNEYDTNAAIKMMREAIPASASDRYDDDQLLNLIDIIWDYYEINGLLDIDIDDSDEPDDVVPELIDYATRMIKKDKGAIIAPEHIEPLVRAEISYEDMLIS